MIPDTAPQHDLVVEDVDFFYGERQVLHNIRVRFPNRKVCALIGPSGCGKSTLLRILNRIYEIYPQQRATGHVWLNGQDVLSSQCDVHGLRARVGMVFQKPVPFPMSIFENVAYAIRHYERLSRSQMEGRVEQALSQAALWTEVRDKLHAPATSLSGGQQQRLCLARAIALRPEILLLDEPTSALDPVATSHIEDLITQMRQDFTIVMVTHNMGQALRVADQTSYMENGYLVESAPTRELFYNPHSQKTRDYLRANRE